MCDQPFVGGSVILDPQIYHAYLENAQMFIVPNKSNKKTNDVGVFTIDLLPTA